MTTQPNKRQRLASLLAQLESAAADKARLEEECEQLRGKLLDLMEEGA